MPYPRMMRICQHFDAATLNDVPGVIREALAKLPLSDQIKTGETVAITVGSWGIANMVYHEVQDCPLQPPQHPMGGFGRTHS